MALLHQSNLISADSVVSALNSTVLATGPISPPVFLAPGATWMGGIENIQGYTSVAVAVVVDQPGALEIGYSFDQSQWDFNGTFPIAATGGTSPVTGLAAAQPRVITSGLRAPFMRVRFTNTGASTQTVFRLQTMLNPSDVDTGSSRVDQPPASAALARTVKAFGAGIKDDGTTTYQRFTNDNKLKVDATFATAQTVTANQGTTPWVVSLASTQVSNFPATQSVTQGASPWVVSGTVSVGNFPATQPVSGTFWQATQPVSLASVPSHPVTQGTSPWVITGSLVPNTTNVGAWTTGTVTTTATTADQTIATYTVPVGKTFIFNGADVSALALGLLGGIAALVAVQNLGQVSVMIGATKVWTQQLASLAMDRTSTPPAANGVPVAAGTVVKVVCTPGAALIGLSGIRWFANISGVVV